jgi:hypothetical protein
MSSKLTQIAVALLLSAVVAPSVFATIILSPEEEQAIRTGTPTAVKNFAVDLVNEPNLDTYLGKLGGTEEEIKNKIGVGGVTSILEDLGTVAQQANAGGLVTQTVQAAIAANVGADVAVTARIGAAPATGTVLGDLDQQIDRIAAGNVVMKTALDTTVGLFGVSNPAGADLNADLTTERAALIAWLNNATNKPIVAGSLAGVGLVVDGGNDIDPAVQANTIARLLRVFIVAAAKNLAP